MPLRDERGVMFTDILVPTDGSDQAERALAHGAELARRYGGTLHLLQVVDVVHLGRVSAVPEERDAATENLEALQSEYGGNGLAVRTTVAEGAPDEEILAYTDEHEVDTVVMGTHGRTGLRRHVLGSIAEKVVRLSDVPVLTVGHVGDGDWAPYDDVLVPTDGSEGAEAAVGRGVDIAATFDATLHSLSVVDTSALGIDVRSSSIMDSLEERAKTALEHVSDLADAGGVEQSKGSVGYGNPYLTVLTYVEEHDIDLVVMGTHGRTGIDRYLLGSVAEKLVRTSPAPVMTVRQAEE